LLILTRKKGEGLLIGNNIRVVFLEIRGKQVRLGIEAPGDIAVLREELLEPVAEENRRAARVQPEDLAELARIWTIKKE
jgi:carbon storage regulator